MRLCKMEHCKSRPKWNYWKMACRVNLCGFVILNLAASFAAKSKMKTPSWFNFNLSCVLGLLVLMQLASPLYADSLWKDDNGPTMLADKKAIAVGDILTIVVSENTSNSKSSSTQTAKSSGIDASISSFLYSPAASGLLTKGGKLPALKVDNKNSFAGSGQIANSETIAARVAVRVVDVLPNKNLIIEGTRHTSYSGEQQDIILRGTVRAVDVQGDNTVPSYNVADATIKIVSKGAVSDSHKRGWFTSLWDKVSPF